MPAAQASSVAVSARPSISAASMLARAGSPTSDAVSAEADVLSMACPPEASPDFARTRPRMLRPGPKHPPPRPGYTRPVNQPREQDDDHLLHPLRTRPARRAGLRAVCKGVGPGDPGV